MAASAGLARMARLGHGALTAAQGVAALATLLRCLVSGSAAPTAMVAVLLWDRLPTAGAPRYWDAVAEAPLRVEGERAGAASAAIRQAQPSTLDVPAMLAAAVDRVAGRHVTSLHAPAWPCPSPWPMTTPRWMPWWSTWGAGWGSGGGGRGWARGG